ncbi:UNVERIFIED_CONTAM: hypothetical protein PYX00_005138 [Menopon gallinae]
MLLEQKPGECCRECKGCFHDGVYHASDSEWRDQQDPCKVYHCKAGVVTISQEVCYESHCIHVLPRRPGRCCSTCKGCLFNGQLVPEGREVTTPDDPCLKCRCYDGELTCSKKACPVLQCPPSQTVHIPGECCPFCRGKRNLVELSKGCIFRTALYDSGTSNIIDQCTTCTCNNGTNICNRTTCPVLTCPEEEQVMTPRDCCPHCPPTEESRAICMVRGKTYEDGESWHLDSCMSCTCHRGSPRCAREMCPETNSPCPANQKLVHENGECCPKCVESDGVCTVFGDPHYRTFDGKFFSFQGSCKYLLSEDCVGRSFSIRVTNDARSTKTSSWTKTISIKIGSLKVNLGQKMRVKINGVRVKPPYKWENQLVIEKTNESVLVKTGIGIQVLWNGNSFLEISAPIKYKNRLCGLCGNFNSVTRDDLRTRGGNLTNDTNELGLSWRVGGKKACGRDHDRVNKASHCSGKNAKKQTHGKCNLIRKKVFDACQAKINPSTYIQSCAMDMCECPNDMCYCESLTAYAHECQRLGVSLGNWRDIVKCPVNWAKQKNSLDERLYPRNVKPKFKPFEKLMAGKLSWLFNKTIIGSIGAHDRPPNHRYKGPPPPIL